MVEITQRKIAIWSAVVAFGASSFVVGGITAILYKSWERAKEDYVYERDMSYQIISEDPAFSKVEVHEASWGGVWYSGSIDKQDDHRRFENKVRLAFGKKRAENMLGGFVWSPIETAPTTRK